MSQEWGREATGSWGDGDFLDANDESLIKQGSKGKRRMYDDGGVEDASNEARRVHHWQLSTLNSLHRDAPSIRFKSESYLKIFQER